MRAGPYIALDLFLLGCVVTGVLIVGRGGWWLAGLAAVWLAASAVWLLLEAGWRRDHARSDRGS